MARRRRKIIRRRRLVFLYSMVFPRPGADYIAPGKKKRRMQQL
jgi:hypothetical protein